MIGRGTAIADIHLPIQLGGDQALFQLWNRWLLERERQVPGVLLGGHIGRDGAGLSPIRGHSNVQGDRTMGIFDRPEPDLLDALEAEFGVAMPRPAGLDTVDDGASGAQFVTVEDSMGMVHASSGVLEPPSSSRIGVVGAEPLPK